MEKVIIVRKTSVVGTITSSHRGYSRVHFVRVCVGKCERQKNFLDEIRNCAQNGSTSREYSKMAVLAVK